MDDPLAVYPAPTVCLSVWDDGTPMLPASGTEGELRCTQKPTQTLG